MSNLLNRIGLHTWTLDTTPLPDVLSIARETGYNAVELRHADFVRCIESGMTNDEVLDMIRASGLVVSCVGLETGMLFAQASTYDEASAGTAGTYRSRRPRRWVNSAPAAPAPVPAGHDGPQASDAN